MATLKALEALTAAVPVMNQKAAAKANANSMQATMSQVAAAPSAPNTLRQAQQAAPAVVQQQTQNQLAAGAATQQTLGQIAQVGGAEVQANANADLASREQAAQKDLADQETRQKLELSRSDLAMRKRVTGAEQAAAQRLQGLGIEMDNRLQIATIRQREQLNRLGGDVREKILDSRIQFDRDEMGRKFSNERQLADYNIANAKTEIELKDRLREMEQAGQRKVQLLEVATKRLEQSLQEGVAMNEQNLNNENRAKIYKMVADMKEKIRKEQAKARNRAMVYQGVGMVVGAAAGAAVAGPGGYAAGAALGASLGGSVGTMAAGSQQEGNA